MNVGSKEAVEWYIVFTSTNYKHWLLDRLMPGFQHVYAMKKSRGGQLWTVVNPRRSHTEVTSELVDDYPHPRCYAGETAVIVPVRAIIDNDKQRQTLCVYNCVEEVKALLGIKDFWLWTPWQLYRRLTGGGNEQ